MSLWCKSYVSYRKLPKDNLCKNAVNHKIFTQLKIFVLMIEVSNILQHRKEFDKTDR